MLDRGRAEAGVLHAYAVDQDQRLRAAAAAHEDAGVGADAAVLCHLEARLAAQQRGQVDGLRIADLLFGENGGVRNRVAQALLGARGSDYDGIFLGEHKRWNQRHEQRRPANDAEHRERPFPRQASPHAGKTHCTGRPISGLALDALTVAGAAQVALGATALAVPVSRLTRAPRGASGTE